MARGIQDGMIDDKHDHVLLDLATLVNKHMTAFPMTAFPMTDQTSWLRSISSHKHC